MVFRPLRYFGDPVLKTPCKEVTAFDAGLKSLITDLLETVDAPGRAGLAAPQIGVGLRAFSYHVEDEVGYVINPVVVETSSDEQDGPEGCLSVPGLYYPTQRARWAKVTGVDWDNQPIEVSGEGLMARCLLHETDHLDGMLYLQRLTDEHRKEAMRQIRRAEWFT